MPGLRNICRAYGGMKVQGVNYVWDYVAEEAVKETEMPFGSKRWKASQQARFLGLPAPPPSCQDSGKD